MDAERSNREEQARAVAERSDRGRYRGRVDDRAVIGGVVSMITDTHSLHISDGAALSAPAVSDPTGQAEFRRTAALFDDCEGWKR